MSVKVTEIDWQTLPEALLATVKSHLRVEFNRDDEYITKMIARAINLYEQFSGRSIVARTVEWTPSPLPYVQQVPFQPLGEWTATAPDGTVTTADYVVYDNGGAVLIGSAAVPPVKFGEGVTFEMVTGYTEADDIPPGALDIILRISAGLYETREHQTVVTMEMVSFWTQDLIVGGGWIPRA